MDMLITDLLRLPREAPIAGEDDRYQYAKELLQVIARLRKDEKALGRLHNQNCWPCRTRTSQRVFCSIGSFYVNDRQNLFDIFSNIHTFLDFDFNGSKLVTALLRDQDCDSFLSNRVAIEMESHKSRDYDEKLRQDLMRNFRSRADALVK